MLPYKVLVDNATNKELCYVIIGYKNRQLVVTVKDWNDFVSKENLRIGVYPDEEVRVEKIQTGYSGMIYRTSTNINPRFFYLLTQSSKLTGLEIYSDAKLKETIKEVSGLSKRYLFDYYKQWLDFDQEGVRKNLAYLWGVRRSGKTILMKQLIGYNLSKQQEGKTLYIVVRKFNSILWDEFLELLDNLFNAGYVTFFVDEATYLNGGMDGLQIVADSTLYSLMLTGTNSAALVLNSLDTTFDRALMSNIGYLSYKEFRHLYKDSTLDEYMELGGLCRVRMEYKQNIDKTGIVEIMSKDYIDTTYVDNLVYSLLHTQEAQSRFPKLFELVSVNNNLLHVMMYKVINHLSSIISLKAINRAVKNEDAGSGLQATIRNDVLLRSDLEKRLSSFLTSSKFLSEQSNISQDAYDEFWELLRKVDLCYTVIGERQYDENSEYIDSKEEAILLPIGIKYLFATELIKENNESLKVYFENNGVNYSFFSTTVNNIIKGEMLEMLLKRHFWLQGFGESVTYKGRNPSWEIDIVTERKALIEIKHSSEVVPAQCRWLLYVYYNKCVPVFEGNYAGLYVFYLGDEQDITLTYKELVDSIGIERFKNERELNLYNSPKANERVTIHYINAEQFLLSEEIGRESNRF